jgi:transcriptional antiterminator Rof (Rho-off)
MAIPTGSESKSIQRSCQAYDHVELVCKYNPGFALDSECRSAVIPAGDTCAIDTARYQSRSRQDTTNCRELTFIRRHCTHLMVEFERGASALSLDRMTKSGSAYAYASLPEDGRGALVDEGVSGVSIIAMCKDEMSC